MPVEFGLIAPDGRQVAFGPTPPLEGILHRVIARHTGRAAEVVQRREALRAQVDQACEKLARLYRAIEEGVVELDDDLKVRTQTLKDERDIARAALERIADQAANRAEITPDRIAGFAALMREKLDTGDTQARKAYLRSVISRIEVDDNLVRIIGEKDAIENVIAGSETGGNPVRSFVPKWRTRQDSNL